MSLFDLRRTLAAVLLLALGRGGMLLGEGLPEPLADVGFDQRLGELVPLDLVFENEAGQPVQLATLLDGRPALLALVYFECPMLCPMVLNGLTAALKPLGFDAGQEFDVLVVSFDHRDTAASARAAKSRILERYGRPGTESGWHFLTGDESSIRRLTDSVGFRFNYLPESEQFAHAAGIIALTPTGEIARYFYGVEYPPRDVRLGLVEAADNKIGSVVDQVLLYCYHYDPVAGGYSAVAMNIVRLGAGAFVVVFALLLLLLWRRQPAAAGA